MPVANSASKKREPSAYNIFVKKTMEKLKKEDEKAGRKSDRGRCQENMKKVAALWRQSKSSK